MAAAAHEGGGGNGALQGERAAGARGRRGAALDRRRPCGPGAAAAPGAPASPG